MRAERLVSILMLLQSRRRLTAGMLAQTLGVSVRTIFRDMDALSMAGIPVYTERGPEGGCRLMEDYHTELTGLTGDEAQALYLLAAPGPLETLEVGNQLRGALRKLFAALPEHLPSPPDNPNIHLDWNWWGQRQTVGDALETLYKAVQLHFQVKLTYRLDNHIPFEQVVNPLGLVAKAGAWYIIFEAGQRCHYQNVARLDKVILQDEHFSPSPDFALRSFWAKVCAERALRSHQFKATILVSKSALGAIQGHFGEAVTSSTQEVGSEGKLRLEIGFEYLEEARSQLLGWGGAVEVIEPMGLRLSMADFARQILSRYETPLVH